jgi:taurine dioxygenase
MQVKPIEPFGVELVDFKVRSASEADFQAFDAAFREHSFVLIRDPSLTGEEQIKLLSRLGPVAVEMPGGTQISYVKHDPSDKVAAVGGKGFGEGELAFHFDMSYTEDFPQWMASLYGEKVPAEGGETCLLHAGRVYDELDEETKQVIAGRRAVHIFDQEKRLLRTREADVGTYALRSVHDLVWDHPYGRGKVLFAMDADTDRIVGMPREEGEAILQKLFKALSSTKYIYQHKWRVGDLVVWDNRVLQHSRNEFDPAQARVLRRVGCGNEKAILLHLRNRMEQLRM